MPLPLNFFLLILMIWNPCHSNLVMISSLLLKCQGHPTKWYFGKSHFVAIPSICNQRFLGRCKKILTTVSLPMPAADWANRSLAFKALTLSLRNRSSSLSKATKDFAFSLTLIPWSLLSSRYWKSFKVWIAYMFSLHCWATCKIKDKNSYY